MGNTRPRLPPSGIVLVDRNDMQWIWDQNDCGSALSRTPCKLLLAPCRRGRRRIWCKRGCLSHQSTIRSGSFGSLCFLLRSQKHSPCNPRTSLCLFRVETCRGYTGGKKRRPFPPARSQRGMPNRALFRQHQPFLQIFQHRNLCSNLAKVRPGVS